MLSNEVIEKVVDRLVTRIEELNTYTLQQMGESVKKIGTLSPTQAQQLAQIMRYGGDYDKIVEKLAKITELNIKDIYDIFHEVAKNDYIFAEQFYKYRNIKYIPYEENLPLKNQVQALATITAEQYMNFTRTLAFTTKDSSGHIVYTDLARTYENLLDNAVLNVNRGTSTFNSEMYDILKELGQSGLKTVNYSSGRSMRLDSAVRMNLRGGLKNMQMEIRKEFAKQYNADGIEISAHSNPAPDHAEVQGRQFSTNQYDKNGKLIKKGEFEKFQNDEKAASYDGIVFEPEFDGHDRRSIGQYNCNHSIFPIVLGVSEPEYSDKELKKILKDNEKGFEYEGEHYTLYEGDQLLRKIELQLRIAKDQQISGVSGGNKELVEDMQNRISELTSKYKEIVDISGLPSRLERARVIGYRRVNVAKMPTT